MLKAYKIGELPAAEKAAAAEKAKAKAEDSSGGGSMYVPPPPPPIDFAAPSCLPLATNLPTKFPFLAGSSPLQSFLFRLACFLPCRTQLLRFPLLRLPLLRLPPLRPRLLLPLLFNWGSCITKRKTLPGCAPKFISKHSVPISSPLHFFHFLFPFFLDLSHFLILCRGLDAYLMIGYIIYCVYC
jgi:hypothetical protein